MHQKTIEDYLKAIFVIYEKQKNKEEGIRSIDIAKSLDIKKPSVSAVIHKLTDAGYLKSGAYSPIFFTDMGLKEAQRIVHNHRVIEYFLKEILKCDLTKVHQEAHNLEHAFSDSTIKKLDAFLGNPTISPYGKRIH